MDLDDLTCVRQNDPSGMLAEIDGLPEQLKKAWDLGQSQPCEGLEPLQGSIKQVVITGMGGSAIGADLLAAYVQPVCKVPVVVHRDYGLPAFASGPGTLVIASSHSGNTEETLDAFSAGLGSGCRMVAICTGGKLAQKARAAGAPVWTFEHHGMPRAAVGYSFGLLLALFSRLGLVALPEILSAEVKSAVEVMQEQQETLAVDVPIASNQAKRMAGQLVGQWVNVIGSGMLATVARRWKGQINELAKAGAGFDAIPEADHNSLAGLLHPEETLSRTCTLFLCSPGDHPRNRKRLGLTHQAYMLEGLRTDGYDARGSSPLAHIWSALHFGDYLAYYLAALYGVDPTPIAALVDFKQKMAE